MTENRRRGVRSQRPKTRDVISEQLPFGQPQMRFEPLRAVSEDELEAIHQSSLKVLPPTSGDLHLNLSFLPQVEHFLR